MDQHLPIHPRTGLQALGIIGGRPVWPVAGGAPDDPPAGDQGGQQPPAGDGQQPPAGTQDGRPDGISDDEWAALGDPGKRAIERERRNARELQRTLEVRNRELEDARRGAQQPPAGDGKGDQGKGDGKGAQPDMAEIVRQAVDAALKPVLEQQAATAAQRIQDRTQALAASVLHNPADAVSFLNLRDMVTVTGEPDEQAIRDGLARLVEERPYLAKPQDGRRAAPGSGQGAGTGGAQTLQQKTQAYLDLMKTT